MILFNLLSFLKLIENEIENCHCQEMRFSTFNTCFVFHHERIVAQWSGSIAPIRQNSSGGIEKEDWAKMA